MVDIKETLRLHAMWRKGEEGGVRADLYEANLRGANLRGANLYGADLYEADLYEANLRGANLYGADLRGANLYGASLRGASLRGASLRGANLYEADLYGADLRGASLWSVRGNGHEIKSMQIGRYDVAYTAKMLQIGCQRKPVAEWFELDSVPGYLDPDGEWAAFKPLIKQIIEQYPATTTGKENQNG